jgi:aspartate/methionine/tyrosine aminotransferase
MAGFEPRGGGGLRRWLLEGEAAAGLPVFCLERWQSLHETRVEVNLAESGVEPPSPREALGLGLTLDQDSLRLGYGWTKGSPELRGEIASWLGGVVDGESIVVTCGSAEANLLAVTGLVGPGDTVVVDMPNYMQVPGLLRLRGARVVEAWRRPEEGWALPVWSIVGLIRDLRPRAVFITNPNNPTGAVERGGLWDIARAAAAAGTVLVVDEVYRGLELEGGVTPTILEAALEEGADAVSVGGLSKAFGLPGLRVGWAAATSRSLADRLWSVKDYTTIAPPGPSEALALKALREPVRRRLLERGRAIVSRNLEALEAAIREYDAPLRVARPAAGAFALVDVDEVEDTFSLAQRLLEAHSLLVNPGECFGIQGYLRVGLGVASPGEAWSHYRLLARAVAEMLAGGGEG